jgi:hypothetical protein
MAVFGDYLVENIAYPGLSHAWSIFSGFDNLPFIGQYVFTKLLIK